MFLDKQYFGEYHTLFREMGNDEISFYKYFRMAQDHFYELMSKIQKQIQKKNTTFRGAINLYCKRTSHQIRN